ncbi:hypothetical protein ABIA96_007431, partial [Bradyrhizobium sp. LB11.1]
GTGALRTSLTPPECYRLPAQSDLARGRRRMRTFPRSSQSLSSRHQSGDQRPLRIGQIACITQSAALILDTSDFGPRHRVLPRIFANPKESQLAEITHSFFGQALRMAIETDLRTMRNLLVANRSEIAIRIFRAASELGLRTFAVYAEEDKLSLHRFKADEAYQIGKGRGPLEAYLSVDEMIKVAKEHAIDAIHPGYGFLSESPEFADACAREGIVFVGPFPETICNGEAEWPSCSTTVTPAFRAAS